MRHNSRFLISSVLLLAVAGCGSWSNPIDRLSPHRIDIQQGNVITQEMLDKLKPGMTPSQVRFILGTPLIVDPFRANRWDYVYHHEKGGRLVEHRRVTAVFENEKLKGLEGDVVAATLKRPETAPDSPRQEGEKK